MGKFLAVYAASLLVLLGVCAGGAVAVFSRYGPDGAVESAAEGHGYNVLTWEVEHFPRKWIYEVRHLFAGRDTDDDEAFLQRYFTLVDQVSQLEGQPDQGAALAEAEQARREMEPRAEDIIEGRMTAVLKDEALAMPFPLFSDLGLIFPPVDFALASPPRVLAVSPRDRIALDRSFLLDPELDLAGVEEIESEAESGNSATGGFSVLAVGTRGVATYPSVLSSGARYESVIDTAFHEWVHQYLTFFPLGRSYFGSDETRTLNETAASLAGHALAEAYFGRHPVPDRSDEQAATPPPSPSPSPAPAFDFTAEMRALRREVEAMLARGEVMEAEALMEAKRLEFVEHGYRIRRLNQAYFAFHGFYGDSPGSIDPIGPTMQELLDAAESPGEFVRQVSGVTSREELDRALAEAQG